MKRKLRLVGSVLVSVWASGVIADPTFVTSTFSAGNENWQPNNWTTTTVNAISPGNPYLQIAADGSGKLGKMITFNSALDWTGNYYTAGVTGIRMDIRNFGTDSPVYLRIALGNRASPQQAGGTWFLNRSPVVVPTASAWMSVFIPLEESDLKVVGNIAGESDRENYQTVFSDIQNIRILSAIGTTGAVGDEFEGNVGVDNVALVPEPTTLPLIGLGSLIIIYGRRRTARRKAACSTPKAGGPALSRFVDENRF